MANANYEMRIHTENYEIRYSGGRLADVYFHGKPCECVQVRDYNFATGEFGPMPKRGYIRRRVADFIRDAGGVEIYLANC